MEKRRKRKYIFKSGNENDRNWKKIKWKKNEYILLKNMKKNMEEIGIIIKWKKIEYIIMIMVMKIEIGKLT